MELAGGNNNDNDGENWMDRATHIYGLRSVVRCASERRYTYRKKYEREFQLG